MQSDALRALSAVVDGLEGDDCVRAVEILDVEDGSDEARIAVNITELVDRLEDHPAVRYVENDRTEVELTLGVGSTTHDDQEGVVLHDGEESDEGNVEHADAVIDQAAGAQKVIEDIENGEYDDDLTEVVERVETDDQEDVQEAKALDVDPQRHAVVNDHADVDGDDEVTLHLPADEDGPVECWYVDEGADVAIEPEEVSAPTSVCSACTKRADAVPEWAQDAIIDEEDDVNEDNQEEDETEEVTDDAGQSGGNTDTAGDVDEPAPVSGSSGSGNTRNIHIAAPDGGPVCGSIDPEQSVPRSANYLQYHEPSLCSRCRALADELPSWVEQLVDQDDEEVPNGVPESEKCWCLRCGDGPFEGSSGVKRHSSHIHPGLVPMTVTFEPDEDDLRGEPDDSLDNIGAENGGAV